MVKDTVKEQAKKRSYITTVGRRKEAIARIRLMEGKGQNTVEGKPINEYFTSLISQKAYLKPFEVTQTIDKYFASILVSGGGFSSQLGAVVHGISRALAKADSEKRTALKRAGLLTRDPRAKERRKYGLAQKARAGKQSPKR